MIKGIDLSLLSSRVEMYYLKDVQGFGNLLKDIILPLNEVAQSLSKEGGSPPKKEVINPPS